MTLGVDYSFARPSPAAIHAAGYRFVVRYLFPGAGKGIDHAEADALAAAGLWIAGVYESTADWMLGGYPAGQIAAKAAAGYARAAGMPEGRPIYFAADLDASGEQITEILNCLRGAASVLGKDATGLYAGHAVIKAAFDAGVIRYGWQTAAWSSGLWDPRAQLRQTRINVLLGGSAIDVNEALTADYGQWMPGKEPVMDHVTTGAESLQQVSQKTGTDPSTILRLTAVADGRYDHGTASYIDEMAATHSAPMPKGIVLKVHGS